MNKNEMSRNETGAHLPPFPELHGTSTETEALSSPVEFGILVSSTLSFSFFCLHSISIRLEFRVLSAFR